MCLPLFCTSENEGTPSNLSKISTLHAQIVHRTFSGLIKGEKETSKSIQWMQALEETTKEILIWCCPGLKTLDWLLTGIKQFLFPTEKTKLGGIPHQPVPKQLNPRSTWNQLHKSLFVFPAVQGSKALTDSGAHLSSAFTFSWPPHVPQLAGTVPHSLWAHCLRQGECTCAKLHNAHSLALLHAPAKAFPCLMNTDADGGGVIRTAEMRAGVLLERKPEGLNWSIHFKTTATRKIVLFCCCSDWSGKMTSRKPSWSFQVLVFVFCLFCQSAGWLQKGKKNLCKNP